VRIAVVGGKLQGVEVVYLALRAGFETILFDRKKNVPACAICQNFIEFDFLSEEVWPAGYGKIDLIFPALEDLQTLELLEKWANHLQVPIVLDLLAFRVSNSKKKSNAVFEKLHLPLPASLPNCPFPVVVKPDQASGSQGVVIAHTEQELDTALKISSGEVIIQQYLEGPSFSIEIIGRPGNYVMPQVTDLFMDREYDCSGVAAPTLLESRQESDLHYLVQSIATEISLFGIMDLEVILHNNELKILEIDARFPSQTPITVYLSTGVNMVEMLAELFLHEVVVKRPGKAQHARIDHIRVNKSGVAVCGEHIMAENGPLQLVNDFFGADEALTTYNSEKREWVATLLFKADTKDDVDGKRSRCLHKITLDAQHGLPG
jgi:3-methylornithine--L-lysine ligase